MSTLRSRIQNAWNAFRDNGYSDGVNRTIGPAAGTYMPRMRSHRYSDAQIARPKFNRIAMDVAQTTIKHVKLNQNGDHMHVMPSELNKRLTHSANLDQTHLEFFHDLVYSLFDEGVVAIVPVETIGDPELTGSFDILQLRVARVIKWFANAVTVRVYNEATGMEEDLTLQKEMVAIIQNPLYSVLNEPNYVLQRLTKKLMMLDGIDEITASGKLDLIIQLPYVVKGELRQQQAVNRRKHLEEQLNGRNKFGVAYIDAAEKIHQLSRPIENNILDQVKLLEDEFYNQVGMTEAVFNGTADEMQMRMYYERTVDVLINRITAEMERKFLSKTGYAQGQRIVGYRDPFVLLPLGQMADIADTFSRNAIISPNEFRRKMGLPPSSDPDADKLYNRNMVAQYTNDGVAMERESMENAPEIPSDEQARSNSRSLNASSNSGRPESNNPGRDEPAGTNRGRRE